MPNIRLRPDLESALRHSPAVRDVMREVADRLLQEAQRLAPVSHDPSDETPGSYRDSLEASVDETPEGVVARLRSADPAAPYIEFGTSDTPAFSPMRRAAESVGLRPSRR